jgi:nitroimidazol reductase NimA-like FMN-containing flavoprotein (pyridoxamine 5'-phosphate oxidase superfamily)
MRSSERCSARLATTQSPFELQRRQRRKQDVVHAIQSDDLGTAGPRARASVEEISTDECLALLGSKSVGRLVVVVADEPDVFPVNYVFDGTNVLFRTAWGLKLMQSVLQRIAFEVDEINEVDHDGWSVVLRGVGEEVTEDLDGLSSQARDELLVPWVLGTKDHWIRVVPRVISGRRLVHR